MTHEPNTEHVLALAEIIREVTGLVTSAALAEAILSHPNSQWRPAWTEGVSDGWHAARVELQCLREQAGVAPAAPTFPRISDSLMRSLIGDVLDESETATKAACMDRPYNPVPRLRARLTEILRLAAQDEAAKRPAS